MIFLKIFEHFSFQPRMDTDGHGFGQNNSFQKSHKLFSINYMFQFEGRAWSMIIFPVPLNASLARGPQEWLDSCVFGLKTANRRAGRFVTSFLRQKLKGKAKS